MGDLEAAHARSILLDIIGRGDAVFSFVTMTLTISPRFDSHPSFSGIFSDPAIPGHRKLPVIFDRVGANEWLDGARDSLEWLVAEDIARTVGFIASAPARMNIQQITVMPTAQAS